MKGTECDRSFPDFSLGYFLYIKKKRVTNDDAVTYLKDKSLADLDNLPDPDVLAEEIAEKPKVCWGVLGK